jgi:hypothetical protein
MKTSYKLLTATAAIVLSFFLGYVFHAQKTGPTELSYSDARFKKDAERISDAAEKVTNLNGVSFTWNTKDFPKKNFPAGKQIGFIAQEVQEFLPEVILTDADGFLAVDYAKLTPLLVEAVKEHHVLIFELQNTLDMMQHENMRLRESITNLENNFKSLNSEMTEIRKSAGGK